MEIFARKAALRPVCALLALALLFSLTPVVSAEVTHGMVTGDKVLFRKDPALSDYWDYLNTGWVGKILDDTTKYNNYTWYKVETNIPVALNRTYVGYIRGDFFRKFTQEEQTAWEAANKPQPYLAGSAQPQTPTVPSSDDIIKPGGDYGRITASGVNLRQTASADSASVTLLTLNQIVTILQVPAAGDNWYKITAGEFIGFVQSDHLHVLTEAEKAALDNTAKPGTQPAPSQGTLQITKTSTNLRKEPGGQSIWQYPIGAKLPFSGTPVYVGGYYWAKVTDPVRNMTGYVRSDCYTIISGDDTLPPVSPTPTPTAGPSASTVRITLGGTNLRMNPGGTVIAVLSRNRELPVYGSPTTFGGYQWVYVYDEVSFKYGYVRSDCYVFINGAPKPTATPAPVGPVTPTAGTLTLIKGGVNLRNAPAGLTIAQLERGLVLPYSSFVQKAGYTWYLVTSPSGVGYVRSDVVSLNKDPAPPAPTPPDKPNTMGYIVTIRSAINLRQTASVRGNVIGRVEKGLVFPLQGPVQTADGYNWFKITSAGTAGFLRGDMARQMTTNEVNEYLATGKIPDLSQPVNPGVPVTTGYVVTTMTSVNVRSAPSRDARTLGQIALAGQAFPLLSTVNSAGQMWYRITYQGQEAYLMGSVARLMTQQEYIDYISKLPSASPVPTATPIPADQLSSTAVTVMDKVLVRAAAGMTNKVLTTLWRQGTTAMLQGPTAQADNYTWYQVTAGGVNGWIRGDMLRILSKDEANALNPGSDPGGNQASYRTLQLGSTGADVTRLQQELAARGYLQTAYVTGTYNDQTVAAVRAFQKDKGLVQDGIAGSNTQHKLYNTVPETPQLPDGGSTVKPTLYPVEIVDWYKGDINTFWGRGEIAVMTDVTTGISLRIKRWAGGYHVDGEPLTAADTKALTQIYKVRNAQEILEKNLYQRRPVWITLKGRSFAASLYGVPHNYPNGDTIPDNDFNGQLCIHFYNSRIHESGKVDANHMKAIQSAYDAAPQKK